MINILFVCSGGTCRSAMAKAIMQDMIKRKNIKGMTSRSAGLFVTNETAMNEKAKVALRQLSVRVPRHKAVQLNEEMLEKSTLVLTMTTNQRMSILNKFPHLAPSVKTIKDYVQEGEIEDPYGKSVSVYYNVARQLASACSKIIQRLVEEGKVK